MGDSIFGDTSRLVKIFILGKAYQVPEHITCLRAFQYLSPENVSYGRFCWNQECHTCLVGYRRANQTHPPLHKGLACNLQVSPGLQILELSEELRWALRELIKDDGA
jgi:hypothetical protein